MPPATRSRRRRTTRSGHINDVPCTDIQMSDVSMPSQSRGTHSVSTNSSSLASPGPTLYTSGGTARSTSHATSDSEAAGSNCSLARADLNTFHGIATEEVGEEQTVEQVLHHVSQNEARKVKIRSGKLKANPRSDNTMFRGLTHKNVRRWALTKYPPDKGFQIEHVPTLPLDAIIDVDRVEEEVEAHMREPDFVQELCDFEDHVYQIERKTVIIEKLMQAVSYERAKSMKLAGELSKFKALAEKIENPIGCETQRDVRRAQSELMAGLLGTRSGSETGKSADELTAMYHGPPLVEGDDTTTVHLPANMER